MGVEKGVVSKISEKSCIILTPAGEFRQIPRPKIPVQVGQEIECPVVNKSWLQRLALVAAAFLIAMVGLTQFQQIVTASPAAYVTLDINPSMELAVDSSQRIIQITALNDDAPKILANLDYKGKDVYQVVTQIIQKAIAQNYVTAGKANMVVTTIVELNQQTKLDAKNLEAAVETPLAGKPLKTKIVVLKAKKADREKAMKVKLSTGKYLFYQNQQQSVNHPSLAEIKGNSIATLIQTKKVKLPEPTYEVTIKSINDEDEQAKTIREKHNKPEQEAKQSDKANKPAKQSNVNKAKPNLNHQEKYLRTSDEQETKKPKEIKEQDKEQSGEQNKKLDLPTIKKDKIQATKANN